MRKKKDSVRILVFVGECVCEWVGGVSVGWDGERMAVEWGRWGMCVSECVAVVSLQTSHIHFGI
jgi:hypothetical protein